MSGDPGLRTWRRAQLASQWPHLLTAVALGVALPISLGVPDLNRPAGGDTEALGVLIVMIAAIGGLFLALAALTGRRLRELLLALAALGLAATHPGLDFLYAPTGGQLSLGRSLLGAAAAGTVAILAAPRGHVESATRTLAVSMAITSLAVHTTGEVTGSDHLLAAAMTILAVACILAGGLAHVRGVGDADGALVAVGVLAISGGLGTTLMLIGGATRLTVGVATITMVSVILATLAALMAFLDALERRDRARDTQRLARSLELARLEAQSRRHAEIAHDQRTALLAIEAAAMRMREHPSDGLADAVAVEAARLQRMLDGVDTDAGEFVVTSVVSPVVQCLEALYGTVEVESDGDPVAWGQVDETAEIVRSLIDNAHEHGRQPVTVRVADEPDAVTIQVRDAGPGVPEALREVVFDRGVTSRPADHTGLGLYASRRLARRFGGDVRILPGAASTFEIRLPVSPPRVIDLRASDERATTSPLRSAHG